MIRKLAAAGATCLAVSAGGASAGGLDFSGQPILALFGKGTRAELSFANINPNISGTDSGGFATGDIGVTFTSPSLSYKTDLTEDISVAVMYDQPFFRHSAYEAGAFNGAFGLVDSDAITVAARYRTNDRLSFHGGLRIQQMSISGGTPALGARPSYDLGTSKETDVGFLVGAAYEIPEFHMLVSLTYNSEITHSFASTETIGGSATTVSSFEVTTPEAINLDFRTPVNRSTLVFGNIRYAKWAGVQVNPPVFSSGGSSLLAYDDDTIAYTFGVAKRFNKNWTGILRGGYEAETGRAQTLLNPTDGRASIGLGVNYTGKNFDVTAGIDYMKLNGLNGSFGSFGDASITAVGVKVGYNF